MDPTALASRGSAHDRPAGLAAAIGLGAAMAIAALSAYYVLSGPVLEAASGLATGLAAQTGVASAVWRVGGILMGASVIGLVAWGFEAMRRRARLPTDSERVILRGAPTL